MLTFQDLDSLKKIGKDIDGDDCLYFDLTFIKVNLYTFDESNPLPKYWGPIQNMNINLIIEFEKQYINSKDLFEKSKTDIRFSIFEPIRNHYSDSFARTTYRGVDNNKFLEIMNNAFKLGYLSFSSGMDGCKCRACGNFEMMALKDGLSDGFFTCWSCKTHPFRNKKGVKENEMQLWEKIYAK